MKLSTIHAGYFKLDGGAMFGVVPKSMWKKANEPDDNNMCTWAMRCLLIEHGNYKILVDTGMGSKQDEKFFSHYHPHGAESLTKSLAAIGYSLDDITDVFLTHLHFDHCGGAIRRENDKLVPTFPKALYWTNRRHWETATNPNEREKASFLQENILPIEQSGQMRYIEIAEGAEWLPDIRIRYVKGHTDAMMLPQIRYGDQTLLYCADLLPSTAHISMPWIMAYDMRPLDTLKEKHRLLTEAAANNWTLFFEHDPINECATLEQTPRGIRVKNTGKLAEMIPFAREA